MPFIKKVYKHLTTISTITQLSTSENRRLKNTFPLTTNSVAFSLFTSGSTGTPKGVLISHQDLAQRAKTESHDYNLTNSDSLLSILPLSFDVGCNQLFSSLISGCRLVILNSSLPNDILHAVKQYKITGISAVPAIWTAILALNNTDLDVAFLGVRYITISGGDLPVEKLRLLKEKIGKTGIYKTYGQTETFRSAILRPFEFKEKMESVGRPVSGTEFFVIDENGNKLGPDKIGEVIHRGAGTMLGYLGDVEGTRLKKRLNPSTKNPTTCFDEVIFTGDTGKVDKEGYLYILGRSDKMIKTSGYRVYPKEITDIILGHPRVFEAVVFAIKDADWGQRIITEIQLDEIGAVSELEMKKYLSKKMPSYMVPSEVHFVEDFPKTASGKIRLSKVEGKYNG